MELNQLADITLGPNLMEQKRLSSLSNIYSLEDMKNDLAQLHPKEPIQSDYHTLNKFFIKEGDVVMNLMGNLTTIVSSRNKGKFISQNMIKIEVVKDRLNPLYLCFLLNESKLIKKQIYQRVEGTVIKRINAKLIKSLEIPLLSLEKQRKIGKIYNSAYVTKILSQKKTNLTYKSIIDSIQVKGEEL